MSADREAAIREAAERRGVFTASDGNLSVAAASWEDVSLLLDQLAAARERIEHLERVAENRLDLLNEARAALAATGVQE